MLKIYNFQKFLAFAMFRWSKKCQHPKNIRHYQRRSLEKQSRHCPNSGHLFHAGSNQHFFEHADHGTGINLCLSIFIVEDFFDPKHHSVTGENDGADAGDCL